MKALPDLLPGHWVLVVAPHAADALMFELIARLAPGGPLRVLDGGDRFKAHPIARALRRHLPGADLAAALERIALARAFTCHQMVTLLEATPAAPHPTLVLDLLKTFYDESVPLPQRQRLLALCQGHLERLARQGPLAVSVRLPSSAGQEDVLLASLETAAQRVWRLEPYTPPPPARLF